MKTILVIWHDAHADLNHWQHLDEMTDNDAYVVYTVGWELETKRGGKRNHVSVAQSISPDDCVDSVIHIPKRMIVSSVVLHETDIEYVKSPTVTSRHKHGVEVSDKGDSPRR
jgi:arginase family enzyme